MILVASSVETHLLSRLGRVMVHPIGGGDFHGLAFTSSALVVHNLWWGHDHAWRITWRPRRSARPSKSRRRAKTYPVRVTKVEAQIKFESTSESRTSLPWIGHPGRDRTLFSMIHIWMESLFDKEANPSGPTSKAIWNQRESSKQLTIQNLSGRCVTVFWAVWAL
jgi:hypothetical protein